MFLIMSEHTCDLPYSASNNSSWCHWDVHLSNLSQPSIKAYNILLLPVKCLFCDFRPIQSFLAALGSLEWLYIVPEGISLYESYVSSRLNEHTKLWCSEDEQVLQL